MFVHVQKSHMANDSTTTVDSQSPFKHELHVSIICIIKMIFKKQYNAIKIILLLPLFSNSMYAVSIFKILFGEMFFTVIISYLFFYKNEKKKITKPSDLDISSLKSYVANASASNYPTLSYQVTAMVYCISLF